VSQHGARSCGSLVGARAAVLLHCGCLDCPCHASDSSVLTLMVLQVAIKRNGMTTSLALLGGVLVSTHMFWEGGAGGFTVCKTFAHQLFTLVPCVWGGNHRNANTPLVVVQAGCCASACHCSQ